jgi:serine phosphatase RsbU (regulator of sigma subunit)
MSQDKYLLGILNSNITKYIVTQSAATRQGGFLEFKPMYIEKVPIPEKDRERRIEEYVNSILSKLQENPDEDVIELEHKINEQVYRLYGLTEEEIRIVEGAE